MKKIIFKELAEKWLEEKKKYVKQSTYAAYLLIVNSHLSQWFGNKYTIDEGMMQNFVDNKLKSGLKQKTIKDIMIVLGMIIKYGTKNHYCKHMSIEYQLPSYNENKSLVAIDIKNQNRLEEYIKNNFSFKNFGIYLALYTGMRIGEICALKFSDINLDNETICVSKTLQRIYTYDNDTNKTKIIIDNPKTSNCNRDIPLTKYAIKILKNLLKVVNKDCYILTNSLKPIEPRTYRNYYNKVLLDLGIPRIKFHGLRHSFATRCIENNCDYKTVSVLLGHSNIGITLNLYVHPNLEQKKKCIQKIEKNSDH